MATFLIGLVVLFVGAAIYGKFCEKVFGPDDRETPAYSKQDGVDYVPMREWKPERMPQATVMKNTGMKCCAVKYSP